MWLQDGAQDALERAREIAREILSSHQPDPLDPAVESWIRERFELQT
jgi:trimethylamine:corrinoid methyltransferase-like protein